MKGATSCYILVILGVQSCSILSEEFMGASLHHVRDVDLVILSKAKARSSIWMNGSEDEVSILYVYLLSSCISINVCNFGTVICLFIGYYTCITTVLNI